MADSTNLILALAGAAAVGGVVYYVAKPAAATTTSTTAATTGTPAAGSITTIAAWNALTPAQQTAYATLMGQSVSQLVANINSGSVLGSGFLGDPRYTRKQASPRAVLARRHLPY
jgi:hypothetical protein